ncbi:MAG: tRNA 2-thiouridine(34) synthase MnmA [Ignavibacteriales bacterium]|nr:MAG: tRNA 2-thiouridine(34) synthase MnmA [Ignavibacteriaceae bacterium]MBW7873213.1 tRNA 2-thiouridine(34) synthase MnmA [Ignavibacteria bacterium]MCZ2142855.1 tRNA 2-thiouridine(34) synthase MnmA [Ignavibacteriales bacterium]OQY76024.1 MAG: tRNA 2-thiouridine(34) synthase MnmA [Ignavibacteriales bacterium UTCHB3]MBV6443949.1 tRNA-specific 2-thiouridylase MnmA [Ignavibacteriaceae bacterium]
MKTALLLSGGVDSSVALALLKEMGHDVTAFYLKIWLQDEFTSLGDCPWEEDIKFCEAVTKKLGVPFEVLPMQNEYWDSVVSYTIDEIKSGRTPNPDIFCNSLIKFGKFFDKIDTSYAKVATGHYAGVEEINGRFLLKVTPDPVKDQTYFLSYLSQEQLSRALFPISNLSKNEVRKIAAKYDLATQDKKDSQGICFLGQIKFKDFIRFHLGEQPGDIVDFDTGKVMGQHNGYYYYTIGQRSGLGLSGGPWFVVQKDVVDNVIYISREYDSIDKERDRFRVTGFNWFAGAPPNDQTGLKVKVRHGPNYYNCTLEMENEVSGTVTIDTPDKGIAPGQFAVFYRNGYCLGGSVIFSI